MIPHILQRLQITALNAMQEAMMAAVSSGQSDIILLSPTGTGKTLAYLLPLLPQIDATRREVQVVILVPSRELALQTEQVFKAMGTPLRMASCYGGRPTMEEHRTLRTLLPHIIVATPGRLFDHLTKENFSTSAVTHLVIDEFDKCLEFGFHDQMAAVIALLPQLRRRILLSATEPPALPTFIRLGQTVRLNHLTPQEGEDRLSLFQVHSPEKDKLQTLYGLLCTLGAEPTLVFVNHREAVDRIGAILKSKGVCHETFHGGMEQEQRERALYKFRSGSCHTLVSTDLAARGLDIPQIAHIIHYHLPANHETYLHRNGRTARWDAVGNAYFLLHEEETLPDYVEHIGTFTLPATLPKPQQPAWCTIYIGRGKRDKLSKMDIVGFLCKKGGITATDLGRVDVLEHYAMAAVKRTKVKQLLQMVKGEKIKGMKTIYEELRH